MATLICFTKFANNNYNYWFIIVIEQGASALRDSNLTNIGWLQNIILFNSFLFTNMYFR